MSALLGRSGLSRVPSLAIFGYCLTIYLDQKVFSKGNMVFDYQKEFYYPQVSDGPKVISNESMDFNDPRDFDDH